jgi:hypothetical protein
MRLLVAAAGLPLLALAAFLVVNALDDDGKTSGGQLTGSSKDAFTLSYPEPWRPLSQKELDRLPGNPLAVVRREDGKGFVVLRREKRAPKTFGSFSSDLTRALDRRVPDFKKQSSRTVRIGAGKAFFYSYIRKRKGTVHTVVIVPAGKRSYALNTVSPGGAEDVARQIARIILSFKV